jgi:hypothetical protein
MGTSRSAVKVLWDTSSDWTIIESSKCSTCIQPYYDTSTSLTFEEIAGSNGQKSYDNITTQGFNAYDTVCVTSNALSCMVKFKWFAVTFQTGMDDFDGIVGMSTGLTP